MSVAIFTHMTVGTNDLEKGRAFYDGVLGALGLKRLYNTDDRSGYGASAPEFMVVKPLDGKAASAGNGTTIGFVASGHAAVNEFHKKALALGGKCEGPPGLRPIVPGLYAAYVRDPSGNKLCAITYKE
jgi:catechol 2,3-dioxygenase-like lactoylglutathione lyase family enzyme